MYTFSWNDSYQTFSFIQKSKSYHFFISPVLVVCLFWTIRSLSVCFLVLLAPFWSSSMKAAAISAFDGPPFVFRLHDCPSCKFDINSPFICGILSDDHNTQYSWPRKTIIPWPLRQPPSTWHCRSCPGCCWTSWNVPSYCCVCRALSLWENGMQIQFATFWIIITKLCTSHTYNKVCF